MAPSPLKAVLLGMFASTAASIQVINAVWAVGGFSTISGPSGNENGHSGGFSLIDQDGNTIYENSAPNDYSACQGNTYTFTLSGGCFGSGQQYEFACSADFDGTPEHCAVLDSSSNELASADGNTDTNFIGIAISVDGYCGVSFALGENVSCLPDSEGFETS